MNKKIESIVVETTYFSGGNPVRLVISIIGLLVLLLGGIMMASIILIIPGIFVGLTGAAMAVIGAPKAKINCPACDTENKVMMLSKSMDCEGCGQKFPIKWNNPEPKKNSIAALFKKKRK